MFGTPSQHVKGRTYQYIGMNIPQVIDGNSLQINLNLILQKYGLTDLTSSENDTEKLRKLVGDGSLIQQGHNRQLGILRFIDSMFRRTWDLRLSDGFYEELAIWFAENHIEEGYTDEMIKEKARSSVRYVRDSIQQEQDGKYSSLIQGVLVDGIHLDADWLIEFMLKKMKMISKTDIMKKLIKWHDLVREKSKEEEHENDHKYDNPLKITDMKAMIDSIFNRKENFEWAKELSIEYGGLGADVYFDYDQHIEIAIYLTERYHVIKLGLDGSLMFWNGKVYSLKAEEFLSRKVLDCTTRIKKNTVMEVMAYIVNYCPVVSENIFEKHEHMIVLDNGTYDIKKGIFSESFNPDNMVRRSIPHKFDEKSSIGDSKQILKDIFNTENNYSMFIDFLSICTFPSIGFYKMFVLLSEPGTGKSQISLFLQNLFSAENITNFSILDIAEDSTNRIDASRSMLNIDPDISSLEVKDISYLLKWITMDRISGRAIYSKPESFKPSSRLMANTNVLFDVAEQKHMEALNDRTHTIILQTKFRGTEQDIPDIVQNKINDENYNGYITLVLKNATKIFNSKVLPHANTSFEEKMIWDEHSGWIMKFCEKYMVKDSENNVRTHAVWMEWVNYAANNGITPGLTNTLTKAVLSYCKMKGTKTKRDNGKIERVYEGYTIRSKHEIDKMDAESLDIENESE